jgi:hypothetical protein
MAHGPAYNSERETCSSTSIAIWRIRKGGLVARFERGGRRQEKRAAELLGINYRSLRHRLQKYGLAEAGDEALMSVEHARFAPTIWRPALECHYLPILRHMREHLSLNDGPAHDS